MARPLAKNNFDVNAFLANIGQGKKIARSKEKQVRRMLLAKPSLGLWSEKN
jgi:hypothetical protein